MLRKFLSVAAAALLISVILLTPASSADTGEATLLSGTHRSWPAEMEEGLTLSYDIRAGTGTINVMEVSSTNYTAYLNGQPYQVVPGTKATNVTEAQVDIPLRSGSYYVVVESAVNGDENGSFINYRIDMVKPVPPASSLPLVLGVGTLALLGAVLYFFADIRAGKR